MRNTLFTLQQAPRSPRLYYIFALSLLLCVFAALPFSVYADEAADSSSSSTSDTTDTDGDDLSLGGDITDAYDKYGGGVDSGLSDVKDQYDGLIDDSLLGFVGACTAWIPAEIWAVVGLSIGSIVVLGIVSWLKG